MIPLLFALLCCVLVRSAPLPEESLDRRFTDDLSIFERYWDDDEELFARELASFDDEELFARDDLEDAPVLVRRKSIFTKIKNAFKKAGKAIKKGFQKVGEGVKKVAKKVGEGVKKAAKKVGEGVKTAAKKTGQFVKKTGAKIAKFGLQVWSTAQSVAAKAAKFIPGVGKPISAALEAASKGTGLAAHKIPVNLGGKLEKGFKVMDKIKNPVGGAAGAALKAFRRDADENYDLFERDAADDEDLWARFVDE